jgi:hypothetical protein
MGVTNRAESAPNPADQEDPKAESKLTESEAGVNAATMDVSLLEAAPSLRPKR